jgi:hypothetical protein
MDKCYHCKEEIEGEPIEVVIHRQIYHNSCETWKTTDELVCEACFDKYY